MTIDRGDTRRLQTTVLTGTTPTDPGALTLTVRDPAGVSTTYEYGVDMEVVRQSAGVFYVDVLFDQIGEWVYQWQSEDPAQLQGGTLLVSPAPLDTPPDPLTVARAGLAAKVAADSEPLLSEQALSSLLEDAARTDADGLAPSDDDWTPTYDLNAAAAAGWRQKAGMAASGYDFGEDGQTFSRSQIYEHCMTMAADYRRLAGRRSAFVSVTLVSPYSGDYTTRVA